MNHPQIHGASRILWVTATILAVLIILTILPDPTPPAIAAGIPTGDYHFAVSSSGGDENTGDLFWVLDDHAGTLLLYQAQEEQGDASVVFRDSGDIAQMFNAAR
jgi:hypothetical protein